MGRKEQRKREEIKTDEPTYEKKKNKKNQIINNHSSLP
jgi:hypothetical protein